MTETVAATIYDLERITKKVLRTFFNREHLPIPKFKIVNLPAAKWLGRTTFKSSTPGNTLIEIQKAILDSPDILEKVLHHELIHHWDFLRNPIDPSRKQLRRNVHDEVFKRWVRKINQRMGKDYIGITAKYRIRYSSENHK